MSRPTSNLRPSLSYTSPSTNTNTNTSTPSLGSYAMPITRSDKSSHILTGAEESEAVREFQESGLERYTLLPPDWRKPWSDDALERGFPGVYAPHLGMKEDAVCKSIVQNGWTPKSLVQNETFSLHQVLYQNLTTAVLPSGMTFQEGAAALYATIAARKRSKAPQITDATLKYPLRATLNEQKRENWLKELADSSVPLVKLARNVPHGFKGERMMEMLVQRGIPPERAVWYLRAINVADVNATRKRPNSHTKFTLDWTIEVCKFVTTLLKEIVLPPAPGQQAVGVTPTMGASRFSGMQVKAKVRPNLLVDAETRKVWGRKFQQTCALLLKFHDEGLLDRPTLLLWIVSELTKADIAQINFVLHLVKLFRDDFALWSKAVLGLVEGCLGQLRVVGKMEANQAVARLEKGLRLVVQGLFLSSPDSFVSPALWCQHREELRDVILEPTDYATSLTQRWKDVKESLVWDLNAVEGRVNLVSGEEVGELENGFSRKVKLLQVLDHIVDPSDSLAIYNAYFLENPLTPLTEKLDVLLSWATTPLRPSDHRAIVACSVLRLLQRSGVSSAELQEGMIRWLEESESDADKESEDTLVRLVDTLAKDHIFSPGSYFQRTVARGESDMLGAKGNGVKALLAEYMPSASASKSARQQQKRSPTRDSARSGLKVALADIRLAIRTGDISLFNTVLRRSLEISKATSASRKIVVEVLPPAALPIIEEIGTNGNLHPWGPEILSWALQILEDCKAYPALEKFVEDVLGTDARYLYDPYILCVAAEAITSNWQVFLATNKLSTLLVRLFDRFYDLRAHGALDFGANPGAARMFPIRRAMAMLVKKCRPENGVERVIAWLEEEAQTTATAGAAPATYGAPPVVMSKEFETVLRAPTIENASQLVSTLFWLYHSYEQWGACTWTSIVATLASLAKLSPEDAPDPTNILAAFVHVCEDVNSRVSGGMDACVQSALLGPDTQVIAAELSPLLRSLLVELATVGVLDVNLVLVHYAIRPLANLSKTEPSAEANEAAMIATREIGYLIAALVIGQPETNRRAGPMDGLYSPPDDGDGSLVSLVSIRSRRQLQPRWLTVDEFATAQILGQLQLSIMLVITSKLEERVCQVAESVLVAVVSDDHIRRLALLRSDEVLVPLLVDLASMSVVGRALVLQTLGRLYPLLPEHSIDSTPPSLASIFNATNLFNYAARANELQAFLIDTVSQPAAHESSKEALAYAQNLGKEAADGKNDTPCVLQLERLPAIYAEAAANEIAANMEMAIAAPGQHQRVLRLCQCLAATVHPPHRSGKVDNAKLASDAKLLAFWKRWTTSLGACRSQLPADGRLMADTSCFRWLETLLLAGMWIARTFPNSTLLDFDRAAAFGALTDLSLAPQSGELLSLRCLDTVACLLMPLSGPPLAALNASLRQRYYVLFDPYAGDEFPLRSMDRLKRLLGTPLRASSTTYLETGDKMVLVEEKAWEALDRTEAKGPGYLGLALLGAKTLRRIETTPSSTAVSDGEEGEAASDEIQPGDRDNFEHELPCDALSTMPLHFLRSLASAMGEETQLDPTGRRVPPAPRLPAPRKRKAAEEIEVNDADEIEVGRSTRSSTRKKSGSTAKKGKKK